MDAIHMATKIFLKVVEKRDFPEFITTYLNGDQGVLTASHSQAFTS
jgi:hypothetical protein